MKKIFQITPEEFTAIQTAIENVLRLWEYDCIEANTEDKGGKWATSMSKETFFESLKREFEIK